MRTIPLLTILALFATGCGEDVESIQQVFTETEFDQVMNEVADDNYTPPADGRLTEAQIEMYIAVKKRETELLEAGASQANARVEQLEQAEDDSMRGAVRALAASKALADYVSSDLRAAHELGVNTAEYEWVRDTLLETAAQSMLDDIHTTLKQQQAQALHELTSARDAATDPALRDHYASAIAELEAEIQSEERQRQHEAADLAAMRHNQGLLERHAEQLNVVEAELKKWTMLDQQ